MDILTAYANKKGWVTAKAGRPDVNRAGNASTWTPHRAQITAVIRSLTFICISCFHVPCVWFHDTQYNFLF